MSDVHVNQTNTPPPTTPPPPPDRDSGTNIWPIVIAILVVVLVVLFFIFSRDEAPDRVDRTEIEMELPEVERPTIEVPDQIQIDVPDEIDINVETPQAPAEQPPTPPPTGTSP
ncbi:MAG TPA: hypothetical protein VMN39_08645 [Longimicrobiaceae bacterium]|nr:hypothetical protein [Longimicrobiaceae bacterium]